MADVFTPEKRSEVMSRIRIRETLANHEHHTDRKAAARDHLRAMRKHT